MGATGGGGTGANAGSPGAGGLGGAGKGGEVAGCAGAGTGSVPPPLCMGPTITYYTVDGCGLAVAHEQTCTNGCVFASATSAKCANKMAPPFRTCATASDCGSERYCADASTLKLLDAPSCSDGVCDWKMALSETCTQFCSVPDASCTSGSAGSTSGSFPWATPATCNGNVITYYYGVNGGGGGTTGAKTATHTCNGPCYTDAKGVGCTQTPGEAPFHSCLSKSDCPDPATRCDPADASVVNEYLTADCPDGSCKWAGIETLPCPTGTSCTVASCK